MRSLKKLVATAGALGLMVGGIAIVAPTAAQATGVTYGTMTVSPGGPYTSGQAVTVSWTGITAPDGNNGGGYDVGVCIGDPLQQAGPGSCSPDLQYFFGSGPKADGSATVIIPTKGANAGFSTPGQDTRVCDNGAGNECNIAFTDFRGNGPTQLTIQYAESTTTALTAAPPSGAVTGDSVDLTATVTPSSATGSVQFKDGATNIGSPVTVSGGTATTSSALSGGSHSLHAVFTGTGVYGDSTGDLSYSVGAAATSTALLVSNASPSAFSSVGLHADVTSGASSLGAGKGSVTFRDGATVVCSNVALTATGADCTASTGFSEGAHTVTAQFTAAVAADYAGSTSAGVDLAVGPPAGGTATPAQQNVNVFVEVGTLSITTPYDTSSNPFDLGSAVMNAGGTAIEASRALSAQSGGITVTDRRAGDPGWTASATISDFAGPGTISGDAVSFSGLSATGDAAATTSSIAALGGVAEPFATAPAGNGSGTTVIDGTLSLSAPTTTPAGSYTALLTLTVA